MGFTLGYYNATDPCSIGIIHPFEKRVYFEYDKEKSKNRKGEDPFGDILSKIETVLKKRGYKVEYATGYVSDGWNLNDIWDWDRTKNKK